MDEGIGAFRRPGIIYRLKYGAVHMLFKIAAALIGAKVYIVRYFCKGDLFTIVAVDI